MKNDNSFSVRLRSALRRNQSVTDMNAGPITKADDNSGLRMGMDFVFSILIGSGLGYGLDRLFGTVPIFVIIFFILGFCAGLLNIFRAANTDNTDK